MIEHVNYMLCTWNLLVMWLGNSTYMMYRIVYINVKCWLRLIMSIWHMLGYKVKCRGLNYKQGKFPKPILYNWASFSSSKSYYASFLNQSLVMQDF